MKINLKKTLMPILALTLSFTALAEDVFKPDITKWIRRGELRGAKLEVLHGRRAGLPLSGMAVKRVTRRDLVGTDLKRMKSGLYLIDLDYIPPFVKEALREYKLTLKNDGQLVDQEGNEAKIFVGGETGLVKGDQGGGTGILSTFDHEETWDEENKATPYPFRCYSFHPWAIYYGGFHRWYDARTYANSYTTDPSGNCSILSPQTNIEYLQTYVVVSGGPDVDSCSSCSVESSRDVWDVGYFWPAHGVPTTYHHAVYKDGGIYFSKTANLTW